jgi:Cohesin domain
LNKEEVMKKFFRSLWMLVAVFVTVFALSGCGSPGSTGSAPISTIKQSTSDMSGGNTVPTESYELSIPSFTVTMGQTITVPVNLNTDVQFCGYEIDLTYNSGIVQITDDNLVNTGAAFGAMVVVNPENGKIIGITLAPQQGNVNIVNLNFKGVAAGETTVSITGTQLSCDDKSEVTLSAASTIATTL